MQTEAATANREIRNRRVGLAAGSINLPTLHDQLRVPRLQRDGLAIIRDGVLVVLGASISVAARTEGVRVFRVRSHGAVVIGNGQSTFATLAQQISAALRRFHSKLAA